MYEIIKYIVYHIYFMELFVPQRRHLPCEMDKEIF